MIRKSVLFFTFLLVLGSLVAQSVSNPGYLGRKVLLGYHLETGLNVSNIRSFGFRHNFGTSFSVKKSLTLGFWGSYAQGDFIFEKTYIDQETLSYRAPGFGVSAEFFPFRQKGQISPIGSYFGVNFRTYFPQLRTELSANSTEDILPFSRSSYTAEWGKNILFGDRLVLKIAGCMVLGGVIGETEEKFFSFSDIFRPRNLWQLKTGLYYLL